MALLFLNTVKYWSKKIVIAAGMSVLKMYSNVYIFTYKRCLQLYDSNKIIKDICNNIFIWTHPIKEWFFLKKMEPFYEPWCSLSYHNNNKIHEQYINLHKPHHHLSFFGNHIWFWLYPVDTDNNEHVHEWIQTIIRDVRSIWTSPDPILMIIKRNHQYISRVLNYEKISDKNTNISLEKTRKHLLCVEYIHPKMAQSIYLDIHPGYYVEGNEIFSKLFVERCLRYQNSAYVFDSDYTLKIMDSMMRTVEMNSNEYMIVDKNNYIIHKQ